MYVSLHTSDKTSWQNKINVFIPVYDGLFSPHDVLKSPVSISPLITTKIHQI